ncbi:Ankyrin repeat protein [Legionella sainthelensi]|uniref:ankyrin repeat domain-containing protein n=1 Tax=Legionella sainthelensi TaxID=28087 RepID=UPI000F70CD9F|nr:ankyrin repeat domain-containing protein [Legionella sainthelensi]VEB35753.1 Ankyrin repeat protein [Legionella sainthelensi]
MKTKVEKLMKANRLEKGELMKKAQRNAYKINIYNHHSGEFAPRVFSVAQKVIFSKTTGASDHNDFTRGEIAYSLVDSAQERINEHRSVELLDVCSKILSEKEFSLRIKKVIPYMRQIKEYLIPETTLEKLYLAIKRDYQHYLYFCNLLKNKKVNIVHTTYDSNFKKIRLHGIVDSNQPECEIYNEQILVHPPLMRTSSLMIPRRCFRHDNVDAGLMSTQTELLYLIANSRTNTALHYIENGDYINDYSMEFGYTPILLALSKGWNHVDSRKHFLAQKPIIEALLDKKALEVNCIHLRNGMTPLHIACLRGDCPELIKALIKRGADCGALDYKGRKPVDMLHVSDEEKQEIICELSGTSDSSFHVFKQYDYLSKQSEMATVPTSKEHKQYILYIRYLLAKSAMQKLIPNFA